MNRVVRVNLGERGYDIKIGADMALGSILNDKSGAKGLLISDTNVDPLYGADCENMLRNCGINPVRVTVTAGEESKNMGNVELLCEKAIAAGLDRKSIIIALGGGMVGDLAGFVAAVFQRGVGFIQIPTSLLAMVDSSVGGKTAVNLKAGKNLVGAFHQPMEVLTNLGTLATLPEREYRSGLAEVVKYGVIWDAELFDKLEKNVDLILKRDFGLLQELIAVSCEIKAEVVMRDEKEDSIRAILNFGHTMGHVFEKICGYGGMLHGEAVSLGMIFAAELSVVEKGFPESDKQRLSNLLKSFGLPINVKQYGIDREAWFASKRTMSADKKSRSGVPRFVLADNIGFVEYGCLVNEKSVERVFLKMCGG